MSEQHDATWPDSLRAFSRRDPAEKLDHMLTEIGLGVPKEQSINIQTAEDSALWDQLAKHVADMRARGIGVAYDAP